MADINIPGVSNKYKTNELVAGLIEVEKLPLKREQEKLDSYVTEQQNWRRVNQLMSGLRESARTLYSFSNPFNDKITSSSDDGVVTAEASREADLLPFKIEVEQLATADRFLSKNLDKNYTVPAGNYAFSVSEKTVSFAWRGGIISDFAAALNKRAGGIIKASLINPTGNERVLLIEATKTGTANKLSFSDDALNFALDAGILQKGNSAKSDAVKFAKSPAELNAVGMNTELVTLTGETLTVGPNNGTAVTVPTRAAQHGGNITFELARKTLPVKEEVPAERESALQLQSPGSVDYKGVLVQNELSDPGLLIDTEEIGVEPEIVPQNAKTESQIFIRLANGSEIPVEIDPSAENQSVRINTTDYPGIQAILLKNGSGTTNLAATGFTLTSPSLPSDGYEPVNPVAVASDARVKYEGIPMMRPDNKIDDVVPNITLSLHGTTDKPVTISVKPNAELAKDAVINLVGKYNQLMTEINILTQLKPEVISEIEYFTDDEREAAEKRLGTLQSDFTLTNTKQTLQRIMSSPFTAQDDTTVRMLSDIGVSTRSGGTGTTSVSQMRGYLEIDEKKLDAALQNNMNDIKNLLGYDTNGDFVIDNGIAYRIDMQIQPYTQLGGIIASKTSGIDTKIRTSQTQIKRLETQVAAKEVELRRKYSQMESALSNLGSQSSTITNFSNQNSGN